MDVALRGLLEHTIDSWIRMEEPLVDGLKKRFEPLLDCPYDFAFGFVVGTILGSFTFATEASLRRRLTDDELSEAVEIINKRSTEIKNSLIKTR